MKAWTIRYPPTKPTAKYWMLGPSKVNTFDVLFMNNVRSTDEDMNH